MTKTTNPFCYLDGSPEVIRSVLMMYVIYALSLRNAKELLAERGIDQWCVIRSWQCHSNPGMIATRSMGLCMRSWVRKLYGAVTLAVATTSPIVAHAQVGLADPNGSGPIVSAVQWLQGTLLGTVATVVAVIAVACVGLMMLSGRINWRHGAVVIVGCFILFGAVSIVAGIRSTAGFPG